jgi:integrase
MMTEHQSPVNGSPRRARNSEQDTFRHHASTDRDSGPAGLSGITLHDLSHFYASGLIAAGCDVMTAQRALGHSGRYTLKQNLPRMIEDR